MCTSAGIYKYIHCHTDHCLLTPTGFLHLLPEVIENMDTAFEELLNGEQEYPFAYFVVCIGFLMVLIIERIVLSCEKTKRKFKENGESHRCETNVHSELPGINFYIFMQRYNF